MNNQTKKLDEISFIFIARSCLRLFINTTVYFKKNKFWELNFLKNFCSEPSCSVVKKPELIEIISHKEKKRILQIDATIIKVADINKNLNRLNKMRQVTAVQVQKCFDYFVFFSLQKKVKSRFIYVLISRFGELQRTVLIIIANQFDHDNDNISYVENLKKKNNKTCKKREKEETHNK
ncbi:hypothetical protein RFI_17803 [Reticulomyxa filosa]|uniref:Uncharacterized protein n=1 Tax=Reticulomyxa filosa TaxID=46433 RepID=X6N2A3_RETFI|nr:hypothetical protein RFI_17803 [Reticulomyxa filosa]|eukprot:ETO19427.1 hypothetical protein RFI_17803 [Reticulomyxa filosa]